MWLHPAGRPPRACADKNGQHYDSHHDAFEEEHYGPQSNQRIATILTYLRCGGAGGRGAATVEGQLRVWRAQAGSGFLAFSLPAVGWLLCARFSQCRAGKRRSSPRAARCHMLAQAAPPPPCACSTPEEGGETVFLLEGAQGLERLANIDYKACNTGIKVGGAAGGF